MYVLVPADDDQSEAEEDGNDFDDVEYPMCTMSVTNEDGQSYVYMHTYTFFWPPYTAYVVWIRTMEVCFRVKIFPVQF